jgi:Homeodomain-like domain
VRKRHIVVLSEEERARLHTLIGQGVAPASALTHARVLLKANQGEAGPGWTDAAIGAALEVNPATVARVRMRYVAAGLDAEGFRPAKGRQRIGVSAITQLLHQLGCPRAYTRQRIPPPPGEGPGPHEWWPDDLAAELAMPPHHPPQLDPPRLGPRPSGKPSAIPVDHPRRRPPARRAPPAPIPPAWLVHPPTLGRLRATSQ